MSCILTGCNLVVNHETFHGDMHLVGKTFVFNAVVDLNTREALPVEPDSSARTYYLHDHGEVFVRRGVFVMEPGTLGWNTAVAQYLGLTSTGLGPL